MNDPLSNLPRGRRSILSRGSSITSGGAMSAYGGQPSWRGETYGGDAGPYTPANPTPTPRPRTPLARVAPDYQMNGRNTSVLTTAPSASAGGTITRGGLTRAYAATPAATPAMNSGGSINGVTVPASPYATGNVDPNRPNAGGTMQRPGASPVVVPPSPTNPPQQTERANPLTGAQNAQPQGTSAPINPARALGMTQRGSTIPAGDDEVGGGSLLSRQFRDRRAPASPYDRLTRSLFSGG